MTCAPQSLILRAIQSFSHSYRQSLAPVSTCEPSLSFSLQGAQLPQMRPTVEVTSCSSVKTNGAIKPSVLQRSPAESGDPESAGDLALRLSANPLGKLVNKPLISADEPQQTHQKPISKLKSFRSRNFKKKRRKALMRSNFKFKRKRKFKKRNISKVWWRKFLKNC